MKLALLDRRETSAPAEEEGAWRSDGERRRRLAAALDELGPPDWRLNLVLVDDGEMTGLNTGYRGIDGITDVLSFGYLSTRGAGPADLAAGQRGCRRDLWLDPLTEVAADDMPVTAGEVVLAPTYIHRACRENGWDLETELLLLVVHGALHVLGWTHDTDADRSAMQEIESELLDRQGRRHPLRARS